MEKFVMAGTGEQWKDFLSERVNNLLVNMWSGLLPEHLTKDEAKLLEDKFGNDWFAVLGYSEPEYRKPTFE